MPCLALGSAQPVFTGMSSRPLMKLLPASFCGHCSSERKGGLKTLAGKSRERVQPRTLDHKSSKRPELQHARQNVVGHMGRGCLGRRRLWSNDSGVGVGGMPVLPHSYLVKLNGAPALLICPTSSGPSLDVDTCSHSPRFLARAVQRHRPRGLRNAR